MLRDFMFAVAVSFLVLGCEDDPNRAKYNRLKRLELANDNVVSRNFFSDKKWYRDNLEEINDIKMQLGDELLCKFREEDEKERQKFIEQQAFDQAWQEMRRAQK